MRWVHTALEPSERVIFRWDASPACLGVCATVAGLVWPGVSFTLSPSCLPWLHGRYPLHRYYGDSDSRAAPVGTDAGLFAYPMTPSDPSHSNHPPAASSPPLSWDLRAGRVPKGTDFALTPQARPSVWPYRVHLHWHDGLGRVFPFRLLPTPPRGDAVAFRFRGVARFASTGTFTRCLHGFTNARSAEHCSAWERIVVVGAEQCSVLQILQPHKIPPDRRPDRQLRSDRRVLGRSQ